MAILEEKTKFHIDNYYLNDPQVFGDLTLWQVGRRFLEPNAVIGEHLHGGLFELTIATGGCATVYTNGTPKRIKHGDIFLSFPGEVHDIRVSDDEKFEYDFFSFSALPPLSDELFALMAENQSPDSRIFRDERIAYLTALVIAEFSGNDAHRQDIIYSLMKEIAVFTIRDFAKAERRTTTVTAPDILCQNVMSYIDTHIYSITSLIEVAEHFKYNYSYLSNLFKRTTGNTLSDYYRIRRLEVARGLIEEGKKNVGEISELLGYSTPFAFSAAFKKHFGASPNFYKSKKHKTELKQNRKEPAMRAAIENLLFEFDFPKESHPVILNSYDKVMSCELSSKMLGELLSEFEKTNDAKPLCSRELMKEAYENAGVHPFEGALVPILILAVGLRKRYKDAGYSELMYSGVVSDIKYKLIECHLVKGIWGTFVSPWFARFFDMSRFCFGKLQFETVEFKHDYEKDGIRLTPESLVINVHIPRTGGRLEPESKNASYEEAAKFFGEKFGIAPIFRCHSWLLFQKHKEIMKNGSNLLAFINDYEIIDEGIYEDYTEVWRLFDTDYTGDPAALPADSSLRRAYIELMLRGEPTGWAEGIYIYSI